ncbi:hypothetical protein GGS20DRAFT_455056 [Poronia punctata]|nr:hypothetical protein GGS20DRAFT_455056 [Poronia punctata]
MYNTKVLSFAALAGLALGQTTTDGGSGGSGCTRSYASLLASAPTPDGQLASAVTSYASQAIGGGATGTGGGMPTPTNPLELVGQVCSFSSQLPQSLQSEFNDYASEVVSYVSAQSSELDAVITNCIATGGGSEADRYTSLVNSLATHTGPICADATTTGGNGTASSTGTPSTTITSGTFTTTVGGGGATGNPPSTDSPTGGAAAPTGFLAGAAAAAGVLGAAILL